MNKKLSKNRTQQPWSGQQSEPLFLEVSELDLFESGIAKLFPQGKYYSCNYPPDSSLIQICITREFPDGSVNCLLANIEPDTGEIMGAMTAFCLHKDLFEQTLQEAGLIEVEDKKSLERLVYDAEKAHQLLGLDCPGEFLCGMNILEYNLKDLRTEKVKMRAPFQKIIEAIRQKEDQICGPLGKGKDEGNSNEDPEDKDAENEKLDEHEEQETNSDQQAQSMEHPSAPPSNTLENKTQSKTENKAQYPPEGSFPIYDSSYCADWNAAKWIEFIYQDRNLEEEPLYDPAQFQPLLFLFERALLPTQEIDPYYMGAINYLAKNLPKLNASPNLGHTYPLNFAESGFPISKIQEFINTQDKNKKVEICHKLEARLEQYPDNPYLGILLHQFYSELEDGQNSYRQACRLYNSCPNRELAVPIYFFEIHKNKKYPLIQQLMDKSVLLENHIPNKPDIIYINTYLFYYHTLGEFLADTNRWPELWRLLQVFKKIIDPQKFPNLAEAWQDLYIEVVFCMNALLHSAENPRFKELLLENILKATQNKS